MTTAATSEDQVSEETKPLLLDRDTMGHWAHKKVETNTLLDYQAEKNSSSMDGFPAMRSAMRDRGDSVWFALLNARMRRIGTQWDAILVGIILGVALLLSVQLMFRRLGVA